MCVMQNPFLHSFILAVLHSQAAAELLITMP